MGRNYAVYPFEKIVNEIHGKPAEKIDISEDGEGKNISLKVNGTWYSFLLASSFHFREVVPE
jgi:hypothetical protein